MTRLRFPIFVLVVFSLGALTALPATEKAHPQWECVAEILGKKGTLSADAVFKVTFPRTDLRVLLDGAQLPVGMGLASWAAFTRWPDGKVLVMGDTVMLASEINPVIDALRAGGIRVSALHNHMAGEQPPIYFLHYQGTGTTEVLARTVRRALDQLGRK